jgi:hypothetical protein
MRLHSLKARTVTKNSLRKGKEKNLWQEEIYYFAQAVVSNYAAAGAGRLFIINLTS